MHAAEDVARDVFQRLIGAHDVEIVVWRNLEQIQNLIQHLAMLCCDAHPGVKARILGQGFDNGRHFDGFGTCAKNAEDVHVLTLCTFLL